MAEVDFTVEVVVVEEEEVNMEINSSIKTTLNVDTVKKKIDHKEFDC